MKTMLDSLLDLVINLTSAEEVAPLVVRITLITR